MFNFAENNFFEKERGALLDVFRAYKNTFLADLEDCKVKVYSWEYSLGPTMDMIPYRLLLAGWEGKIIEKLNKRHLKSRNLFSYGLDMNKLVLLYKYGFNKAPLGGMEYYTWFIDIKNNEKFILNTHIYQSSPSRNKLESVCHSYKKGDFIYYIAIIPYHHWFVRVDKIINGKIITVSSCYSNGLLQYHFDFFYNSLGHLKKIMTGNKIYWEANSGLSPRC